MLSHRTEREIEYSIRRFHSTPLVFAGIPHRSPLWYNLHSYLFVCHWGESKRAYISLTSIRFWWFMQKGEKVLAQSKRTAPPPISKILVFQFVFKVVFSNWYLIIDIISNWYTLFKINIKTLLNTKRRISSRGSFV